MPVNDRQCPSPLSSDSRLIPRSRKLACALCARLVRQSTSKLAATLGKAMLFELVATLIQVDRCLTRYLTQYLTWRSNCRESFFVENRKILGDKENINYSKLKT